MDEHAKFAEKYRVIDKFLKTCTIDTTHVNTLMITVKQAPVSVKQCLLHTQHLIHTVNCWNVVSTHSRLSVFHEMFPTHPIALTTLCSHMINT